jgi:hypothetical protein
MLILRGVVTESIDIAQLIGGAPESGGTHTDGGAFDVWQHDPVTQEIGREMGAATWNRIPPYWTGSPHTHGVLNDCPHNAPARYQIDALAAGYSGLGSGGRGSSDYGPGPQHLRTWREGIAWATKQLEGADMNLNDDIYPDPDKTLRVGQLFRQLAAFMEREDKRAARLKDQIKAVAAAVDALPEGATKAEVKTLLNNLDATIQLVVNDESA